MANSAYLFNANALQQPVHQVAHGFSVGELIRWNGASFVYAQGDSEANAEQVVMVSNLNGVDDFWFSEAGVIAQATSADTPYVSGTLYYLSTTVAGALQTAKPTNVGEIILPCFMATSTTGGIFLGGSGTLIEAPSAFQIFVVNANTQMISNAMYIVDGGASIDLTLPVNFSAGDTILIRGAAGNGWVIKQNASQYIRFNGTDSTVGVGGSITSNADWNTIDLDAFQDDTAFQVVAVTGTPSVV